eukprot:scaffold62342_cov17-Tisochrysis_lutea.AAC.4
MERGGACKEASCPSTATPSTSSFLKEQLTPFQSHVTPAINFSLLQEQLTCALSESQHLQSAPYISIKAAHL